MIDTSEWPSTSENTPELDELPWYAEDQRLAISAGTELVIEDQGIVTEEDERCAI